MFVEETQTYTQDPSFPLERTTVHTQAHIVSNSWFSSQIEGFGHYRFKKNLQRSKEGLLHVLKDLKERASMNRKLGQDSASFQF